MLKVRDPLSERVHLSPLELLAHSFGAMAGEAARRAIGRGAQSKTAARRMSAETADNANYGSTASGSSFYAAMRILPQAQREAMFQIYSFCRQVDDIADSDGPRAGAPRRAPAMARRHRRALSRHAAGAAEGLCRPR